MTIRERDGRFQAIIVLKKDGAITHREAETFSTRRLAAEWRARTLASLKAKGPEERVRARTTLAELIEDFRAERQKYKPLGRSMLADLDMLSRTLGSRRLDAINPDVVTAFARARRTEGAGPATVGHNLATLRLVLNAAKPMFGISISGEVVSTALANLSLSGVTGKSAKRDRRASDAELGRLVEEFERIWEYPSTVIPMHVIVRLAVKLPRRIGELCSMRWEDYKDGVVILRDTKHPRHPRTEQVPVPPEAQALIASLPRIDERILPYKSESCSAAFDRACDRLKIQDLHLHDLRHEGISRLFEVGLSIPEVSLISGHMSWTVLKRYTHIKPESVLEKMQRVGA